MGDLMFHAKTSAQDVMDEQAHCHDETADHQLPIAVAFWITWIVSTEECSNLTQNLLLYSLSHFECDGHTGHMLNGVCHPHWLVQWSRHCSCVRIPVHSPCLPGYIDIMQTLPVMLTMSGLFLDRPVGVYIYIHTYVQTHNLCIQISIQSSVCINSWY